MRDSFQVMRTPEPLSFCVFLSLGAAFTFIKQKPAVWVRKKWPDRQNSRWSYSMQSLQGNDAMIHDIFPCILMICSHISMIYSQIFPCTSSTKVWILSLLVHGAAATVDPGDLGTSKRGLKVGCIVLLPFFLTEFPWIFLKWKLM